MNSFNNVGDKIGDITYSTFWHKLRKRIRESDEELMGIIEQMSYIPMTSKITHASDSVEEVIYNDIEL